MVDNEQNGGNILRFPNRTEVSLEGPIADSPTFSDSYTAMQGAIARLQKENQQHNGILFGVVGTGVEQMFVFPTPLRMAVTTRLLPFRKSSPERNEFLIVTPGEFRVVELTGDPTTFAKAVSDSVDPKQQEHSKVTSIRPRSNPGYRIDSTGLIFVTLPNRPPIIFWEDGKRYNGTEPDEAYTATIKTPDSDTVGRIINLNLQRAKQGDQLMNEPNQPSDPTTEAAQKVFTVLDTKDER